MRVVEDGEDILLTYAPGVPIDMGEYKTPIGVSQTIYLEREVITKGPITHISMLVDRNNLVTRNEILDVYLAVTDQETFTSKIIHGEQHKMVDTDIS